MKQIIYYHFLNWSQDRPGRPVNRVQEPVLEYSAWRERQDKRRRRSSSRKVEKKFKVINAPYKYYRTLLVNDDPYIEKRVKGSIPILFNKIVPTLLKEWNLKHSFEFKPMRENPSYFGPSIIRIGITKALKRWEISTYALSFARFFGGDLWINSDYFAYHGFDMTPITNQIRFFLTNLGYHPLERLAGKKESPYGRYKGYLKKGVTKRFESVVRYFHLDEVKQYKTPSGEKGTYIMRSYTKP